MSGARIAINRPLVGMLTVICYLAAAYLWLFQPNEDFWLGGFVRVALLMSAFWLALPSNNREAAWANVSPSTFVALLITALLLPRYPRAIFGMAVVLLPIWYVLKPRKKRRPPEDADRPAPSL
ncbi:MAG: hypothetical protein ABGZ17_13645 [Planctomycetaceae bacterium]